VDGIIYYYKIILELTTSVTTEEKHLIYLE